MIDVNKLKQYDILHDTISGNNYLFLHLDKFNKAVAIAMSINTLRVRNFQTYYIKNKMDVWSKNDLGTYETNLFNDAINHYEKSLNQNLAPVDNATSPTEEILSEIDQRNSDYKKVAEFIKDKSPLLFDAILKNEANLIENKTMFPTKELFVSTSSFIHLEKF